MSRRIIDTNAQQHCSARAALSHFGDLALTVKGHFMYAYVAAGLQAAACFNGISINQPLTADSHRSQCPDLAVRSDIETGTQVTHPFQDPRMRISFDSIIQLYPRQMLFQKAVILFYLF